MVQQKIGFHHLCILVNDFNLSKHFYTEALGAECYMEWKRDDGLMSCLIQLNDGGVIEMVDNSKNVRQDHSELFHGHFAHVAFHAENVGEAMQKALEHGATLKEDVIEISNPYHMRLCSVFGPSGEVIEFLKYL